jgi:hypothetical protein
VVSCGAALQRRHAYMGEGLLGNWKSGFQPAGSGEPPHIIAIGYTALGEMAADDAVDCTSDVSLSCQIPRKRLSDFFHDPLNHGFEFRDQFFRKSRVIG